MRGCCALESYFEVLVQLSMSKMYGQDVSAEASQV
jgi:hypothetical protein